MTEPDSVVFIIDDDAQVRESLANLCRSVNLNVHAFASTDEYMSAEHPAVPSCIILDVRFPGSEPSGLDFQRGIDAHTSPPIIFITGHGDIRMSVEAMKRGALEFLTKPVREQELLDAIRRGIQLDRGRREEAMQFASLRAYFDSLTPREREIMKLVTQGYLNKQIASEIGLSEVTVKAYRGRIMQKMRARSFAALVRMSDRLNDPDLTSQPVNGNGAARPTT